MIRMSVCWLGMLLLFAADRGSTSAADWLIDPSEFKASIRQSEDTLVLENGLISRTIQIRNGCSTISLKNLTTSVETLRSVRSEATLTIDGQEISVGGLAGQKISNFLDSKMLSQMKPTPSVFELKGFDVGETKERFPWKKQLKWMPSDLPWPPPGKSLTLHFETATNYAETASNDTDSSKPNLALNAQIDVHYEIYDGIPLISKWFVLRNVGDRAFTIDRFVAESLGVTEPESLVDEPKRWQPTLMHVETDYAFNSMHADTANLAVQWKIDPDYKTQVNYELKTPCLLECSPPFGPAQRVSPGESFESIRVFELLKDSTERERSTLAVRKMYRTVAPWCTQNPIMMHTLTVKPAEIKAVIDQAADCGFEMIILSFGSGFNIENRDPKYLAAYEEVTDYAESKGIAVGAYSLLASRGAADIADNTQGIPARFNVAPCLGSKWGQEYLEQLRHFLSESGFACLEHDGSYPGDRCNSTVHPGHQGLDDSQWVQWREITSFYKWCCANGVYINIPDWYFLNGGTKTGMGYREVNWSLPREQQVVIERQNVFDGTWEKTPSMGWMFVPLTVYHGGGVEATIEPLKEHLPHYQQRLEDLFGAGVQAAWRGPRLYDSPETRELVRTWVAFYKQHRAILDSDVIHVHRADGRGLDCILHANPALKEKGLLMVYNPTDEEIAQTLDVPLYYTGLTDKATVSQKDGSSKTVSLNREYKAPISVKVPAQGATWVIIE